MNGMNAVTGKPISGVDHLRQSIADILSTPIGTRIGRRDYGSLLPELIDQPANPAARVRIYAATALALLRWEPRLRVTRVQLMQRGISSFEIQIDGIRTDAPRPNLFTRVTVPLVAAGALPVFA